MLPGTPVLAAVRRAATKLSPMNPQGSANPRPEPEPVAAPPSPAKLLHFPAPAAPPASETTASALPRALLLGEFVLLFVALPLAVFFHVGGSVPPLDLLWLFSVGCLALLLLDPTFDRRRLWNAAALRRQWPQMLALFGAGVAVITVLVHDYAPKLFLSLPRHHPALWAMVLASYPPLSVLPQTLVYRVFLFHRYRSLMPGNANFQAAALILISAAAFCFSHIVFHNWIALALTLPGGVLFAARYHNTRSLVVSALEHTLYGWLLFTLGLGGYFGVR